MGFGVLDGRWRSAVNMVNPLGTKGNLAHAFANIVRDMWQGESAYLSPITFRVRVSSFHSSVPTHSHPYFLPSCPFTLPPHSSFHSLHYSFSFPAASSPSAIT